MAGSAICLYSVRRLFSKCGIIRYYADSLYIDLIKQNKNYRRLQSTCDFGMYNVGLPSSGQRSLQNKVWNAKSTTER